MILICDVIKIPKQFLNIMQQNFIEHISTLLISHRRFRINNRRFIVSPHLLFACLLLLRCTLFLFIPSLSDFCSFVFRISQNVTQKVTTRTSCTTTGWQCLLTPTSWYQSHFTLPTISIQSMHQCVLLN